MHLSDLVFDGLKVGLGALVKDELAHSKVVLLAHLHNRGIKFNAFPPLYASYTSIIYAQGRE